MLHRSIEQIGDDYINGCRQTNWVKFGREEEEEKTQKWRLIKNRELPAER